MEHLAMFQKGRRVKVLSTNVRRIKGAINLKRTDDSRESGISDKVYSPSNMSVSCVNLLIGHHGHCTGRVTEDRYSQ